MPQNPQTITLQTSRSSRNIFPHILVLIGGLLLFFDLWVTKIGGAVALLAGIFAMFARTGMELDTNNKRYRDFIRLGSFRLGKWKELPQINYVAIVRVRLSQLAFRPSEATFRQSDDKMLVAYNVNLIFKEAANKVLRVSTGNLEQAMQQTVMLAGKLGLQIYDCSTSNKRWLDPQQLKQ